MAGNETPKATPANAAPAVSAATPEPAPDNAQQVTLKARKALGNLKKSGFWNHFSGIARDLVSEDQPTRRMARYFFVSVAGIILVLISGAAYFREVHLKLKGNSTEEGKNFGEFIAKQAEEAKARLSSQSLGTFTLELKTPDGKEAVKRPGGAMNLAELEIVVTCDEKETCEFIEDNMPQVRNQLTDVFVAMNRDELLSKEGKHRLKARVLQKLNLWLPKGKIENLYFDKLVVS